MRSVNNYAYRNINISVFKYDPILDIYVILIYIYICMLLMLLILVM